jgi:Leucine carboxyl methyltransferase
MDSITHVSDTARWTALHRATESARPDALFSDPLAERLAGEHGRAIVANVPRSTRNGWWLVARTKIIDDAIAEAIAAGCDRVLNLAAHRFRRLPMFMRPLTWPPSRTRVIPAAGPGAQRRCSPSELPDADPVDEHVRGVGSGPGIAATRTGDRKVEHRKDRVAGAVERPVR